MDAVSPSPLIDGHVHLVGNGRSGSGCWMRIGAAHRPLAAFMLNHIGVKASIQGADFDEAYVAALLRMVQESSFEAAVLLAHEEVYTMGGEKMQEAGSSYVPNDYVLRLGREHPEFLPAVSIHPARPDALDELERCLAAGAVMMKCLPNCQNIDCSAPKLRGFWTRMAEVGLPLLAHTGGEHTVPVIAPEFADPRTLRLPLECGVNVIAAHCATKSGLFDPEYFHVFTGMLRDHTNLYGDTSAFNVPMRGRHLRACLEPQIAERLVHGSDFPVPVFGHWAWARRFITWKEFRRTAAIPNVLERDYQIKLAMGFSADHFTRINGILRSKQS